MHFTLQLVARKRQFSQSFNVRHKNSGYRMIVDNLAAERDIYILALKINLDVPFDLSAVDRSGQNLTAAERRLEFTAKDRIRLFEHEADRQGLSLNGNR